MVAKGHNYGQCSKCGKVHINPNAGNKYSEESRRKCVEAQRGRVPWNKGLKGVQVPWNKDLTIEDPRVQKYVVSSNITKRAHHNKSWNRGKTKVSDPRIAKYGHTISQIKMAMDPVRRSEISSIAARALDAQSTPEQKSNRGIQSMIRQRKGDTAPERALNKILDNIGVKYERQYPIGGFTLADDYIPPNIVLYADGDYWHTRPGCLEHDMEQTRRLETLGYQVMRFWECDLMKNPEQVQEAINKVLVW